MQSSLALAGKEKEEAEAPAKHDGMEQDNVNTTTQLALEDISEDNIIASNIAADTETESGNDIDMETGEQTDVSSDDDKVEPGCTLTEEARARARRWKRAQRARERPLEKAFGEDALEKISDRTIKVIGIVSFSVEKEPGMATAFKELATAYKWAPILPEKLGFVEFYAVWKTDFMISLAPHPAFFDLVVKNDTSNAMTAVQLDTRSKPCSTVELGWHDAPYWHLIEGYFRFHLEPHVFWERVWPISSRHGRAELLIRSLTYLTQLIGDKAEKFSYLDLFVQSAWDVLQNWGFNADEIHMRPDGWKTDLMFADRAQFRTLYEVAAGTNLRFFAIEVVDRMFNAAAARNVPLPGWIQEDFLDEMNEGSKTYRDDLKVFRADYLMRCRDRKLVKLPWAQYYRTRQPIPWKPHYEREVAPPGDDAALQARPWNACIGAVPSAAEVQRSIDVLLLPTAKVTGQDQARQISVEHVAADSLGL